ncbi:hypothetical protein ABTN55_19670, partial [Acinetobacter baumannii]
SAPELGTMTVDYVPDQPVAQPAPAPASVAAPQRAMSKRAEMSDSSVMAMDGGAAIREVRNDNAQVAQAPFQAVYAVPGRVSVLPTGEAKRV